MKTENKKETTRFTKRRRTGAGIRKTIALLQASQINRACDAFWANRGIEQPRGICFRVFQS